MNHTHGDVNHTPEYVNHTPEYVILGSRNVMLD